jgi:PAS domain S-box-containing protein
MMRQIGQEIGAYGVAGSSLRRDAKPRISISAYLWALVFFSVVPLLGFLAYTVGAMSSAEASNAEHDAVKLTRTIADAVDVELTKLDSSLSVLANAPSLRQRDLARFHADAREFARSQEVEITLLDADGQLLLNSSAAWGSKLGRTVDPALAGRVLRTGQTAVLNSLQGHGDKRGVAIMVPVPTPRQARLVLLAGLSLQSLRQRLSWIEIRSPWRAVLLDANGARLWGNEAELTGSYVPVRFKLSLSNAKDGKVDHTYADGTEAVNFVHAFGRADWTVVVGVPKSDLDAPFHRSMLILSSIGVVVLALGLFLSWRISRKIRGTVRAVERQAVRLGRGEAPNLVGTEIKELHSLALAIYEAGKHRSVAEEALRESEAGLKRAQAMSSLGSWRLDLRKRQLTWSDEIFRIFGLPPDFVPTYEAFLARVHPDDRAAVEAAFSGAVRDRVDTQEIEHRIVRDNGEIRFVKEKCEYIRDNAGRIVRAVGMVRDITERSEHEAALRAAKIEAERANNAKSRFLAAASHDLRQPLSALALYVGVLNKRMSPEDRPLLHHMKDCVRSLSELLTDLLDLSKLDAGVVTPNISDFAIAEMMDNLVSVHGPEAQLKDLRLRCVGSKLVARTDAVLFRRMLGNLLSNALRYTNKGSVLIGCRRRDGKVWVEVWDSGIGFPEEKTPEIFEEFKQLGDDSRTRGSGLGLAIVAKSAALLGLQIRVRSKPGRGSMFAVEMPLGTEAKQPAERRGAPLPMRIGLVEDNPDVRLALVHALRAAGHEVIAAATGEELQTHLDGRAPELLISDYRLAKGETGFEVITSLREAFGQHIPAVLITGDTDPELMRSMDRRGIVVRHKPLEIDASQNWVADVLDKDKAMTHRRCSLQRHAPH